MCAETTVNVAICFLREPKKVPVIPLQTTAEEVILYICKLFDIGPVARHLFALRNPSTKSWMVLSKEIETTKNITYEFALRFNVPNVEKLRIQDENAYDFYFKQARYGILNDRIPDLNHETHKSTIMGLGVLDMYRAYVEDHVSRERIERDYRKYMPNWVKRKHWLFLKNPIIEKFNEIRGRSFDTHFVKSGYLDHFKSIVPNYLSEEFPALMKNVDSADVDAVGITLRVSPYDKDFPGISYKAEGTDEWQSMCKIDELCYIISRPENDVILNRKNGIPLYLRFPLQSQMESFITLCDGYYRLMVKWTFNICRECKSPSLTRLLENKCHGPVSGEFSYKKLELKRNYQAGCFIIRESDKCYKTLFLDVCTKDNCSPTTFRIDITDTGEYQLEGYAETYPSLKLLINDHRSGNHGIPLKECLPSSEYDDSNLLLCKNDEVEFGKLWLGREEEEPGAVQQPVCISSKSLLVFKNDPKTGFNPHTVVYRAMWVDRSKNVRREVAIKALKDMNQDRLNEFLSLTSRWVFINTGAVTKLFGISLANPLAMVMEYFEDGQLDVYLSRPENRSTITEVNLVEASASLANALYYLEEAKFVHGMIRCRKLLVRLREDGSFIVKLTDPGVRYSYSDLDLWWIPPEYYSNKDEARNTINADVWAFGTTLWEIFSYGSKPAKEDSSNIKKIFEHTGGLPPPEHCPPPLYRLMRECWSIEPDSRKQPQAIMRDINQIFYQIYNVQICNSYSMIGPSNATKIRAKKVQERNDSRSDNRSCSTMILGSWDDENSIDRTSMITVETDLPDPRSRSPSVYQRRVEDENKLDAYSYSKCPLYEPDLAENKVSITSMQSIFELGKEWSLVMIGKIGQGFYGEVYRGKLMHMYEDTPDRIVAVKTVKSTLSRARADFDREISIMRKLDHPNIIKFEGILQESDYTRILIMEYMEQGQLHSYLNIHKDNITTQNLLKYALDIANGMAYLAAMKLLHRDLAARNILVCNRNHVKISDFGLAQFIEDKEFYYFKSERELPIKWYAPEALEFGRFSVMSDVWSYGVTLYELFTYGSDPVLPGLEQKSDRMLQMLQEGVRLALPPKCPPYVYETLMMPCWEYEAAKRPTFEKLRKIITDDIWGGHVGP